MLQHRTDHRVLAVEPGAGRQEEPEAEGDDLPFLPDHLQTLGGGGQPPVDQLGVRRAEEPVDDPHDLRPVLRQPGDDGGGPAAAQRPDRAGQRAVTVQEQQLRGRVLAVGAAALADLRDDPVVDDAVQPPEALRHRSIWAVENRVNVSFHTYTDITLRDFVHGLLRADLKRHREKVTYSDNLPTARRLPNRRVRVADVLREINHFLDEQKKFLVVAESGDSLFGGIDVKVGGDGLYLAQGFYASMGFAVPGSLGAQIGTGFRPLVLTGDGGFQMTGVEIAHAPRYRLNPIVVLLNNGGWGIFRPISKRQDLLALPSWRYAELARLWGGRGFRVETAGQLRRALEQAAKSPTFAIQIRRA